MGYIIAGISLLILFAVIIAADMLLPKYVFRPKRRSWHELRDKYPEGIHPDDFNLEYRSIVFKTDDNHIVKGYFIQATAKEAKSTILLLHGVDSSKESALSQSLTLAKNGHNVVIFDARGHGESGGIYTTFGYKEKHDVSRCIDFIQENFNISTPIGVWGFSMGGAVALQVMEIDDRIAFGIIESTFTSLKDIFFDYMARISGVKVQWISNRILKKASDYAGFEPKDIRPIDSAKGVKQPTLVLHGESDKKISIRYGQRIYKNLSTNYKRYISVPDGDHENIREVGGDVYQENILTFIKNAQTILETNNAVLKPLPPSE